MCTSWVCWCWIWQQQAPLDAALLSGERPGGTWLIGACQFHTLCNRLSLTSLIMFSHFYFFYLLLWCLSIHMSLWNQWSTDWTFPVTLTLCLSCSCGPFLAKWYVKKTFLLQEFLKICCNWPFGVTVPFICTCKASPHTSFKPFSLSNMWTPLS